ncbi:hypothetical protein ACJMK2_020798 [Sinanodonta woodiana]|uniref:Uncharacterized protein n=1 Tax=Sinanodonta woodiana TaxID=1069815 RepID=A0ABD3U063_SINWO
MTLLKRKYAKSLQANLEYIVFSRYRIASTQPECGPQGHPLKDTVHQHYQIEKDLDVTKYISVQQCMQDKNGLQQHTQADRIRACKLALLIQQSIDNKHSSQESFEHVEIGVGIKCIYYNFLEQRLGERNCLQPRLNYIKEKKRWR